MNDTGLTLLDRVGEAIKTCHPINYATLPWRSKLRVWLSWLKHGVSWADVCVNTFNKELAHAAIEEIQKTHKIVPKDERWPHSDWVGPRPI